MGVGATASRWHEETQRRVGEEDETVKFYPDLPSNRVGKVTHSYFQVFDLFDKTRANAYIRAPQRTPRTYT